MHAQLRNPHFASNELPRGKATWLGSSWKAPSFQRAGPLSRLAILPPPGPEDKAGREEELAQRTCVFMPHRVSYDSTEDDPAGHADGNGTGIREKAREL